jgi:hypothetical protein
VLLAVEQGLGAGFGQAAVVTGNGLLDVAGEVVPEMPAVGDLDRLRRRGGGGFKW